MCLRVDMAYNPHLRRQVASFIEGGVILAVYRNRKRRPIARNLHPVTLVLEGSIHWRPGMSRDPHSSDYIRPSRARLDRQRIEPRFCWSHPLGNLNRRDKRK
jgi:hypothetical protein